MERPEKNSLSCQSWGLRHTSHSWLINRPTATPPDQCLFQFLSTPPVIGLHVHSGDEARWKKRRQHRQHFCETGGNTGLRTSAAWWALIALLASLKLCGSEMFISCMSGFSDVIFPLNYALPVLIWPGFALVLAWFWSGSGLVLA